MPDARRLQALLLCACAAAARLIVGTYITDDAYITMRYSRNLLAGAMSYNPPDAVLGTSTPLWTWILAAGHAAGAAPETTAVAAAAIADMLAIVLLLTVSAPGSIAAIAAAATIAAWPAYVMYAVSGMETSLYVLIVVAFATALGRGRVSMAAGVAAVGALCRPDGALLVVLGLGWVAVTRPVRDALRFLAVAALLSAPWAIYATARFGSIVPASVRAKAAAMDPWFTSLQNVYAYFFEGIYVALTLLAVAGCAALARDGGAANRPLRIWIVWAAAYLAAMTAANGLTHFPWYFVPLLPVYTAAAACGLAMLAKFAARTIPAGIVLPGRVFSTPVLQTLAAAAIGVALLMRMPPLKAYLDAAFAGRERLYASVATELASVDPACTVAATEIGTIGYYYPGRVLDLVGLVSPEVVGRPLDTVLAESNARWLVTYDTHFDRGVAAGSGFSSMFERRRTIPVGAARALEVYERRDPVECHTPQ